MKVQKIKETLEQEGYYIISACNQIVGIGENGNGYYLGEIFAQRIFHSQGKVLLSKINEDNAPVIRKLKMDLFLKDIPYKF
ncbi:MAG: hypothetical protein WC511_03480 [Candidatus Pacearchaeota archaeon]